MNTIDNSKETLKSSASPSGSLDEEVNQKKAILEYGNSSIMHGYDFAIELLNLQGFYRGCSSIKNKQVYRRDRFGRCQ